MLMIPPAEVLRQVVHVAVMAPSSHNTQPWKFRIHKDVLEVHTDPARHLPVIDADGRQRLQSCACALYNARVGVRAMGFVDEVTVMLTDDVDRDLVATLHLGAPHISTETDLALMRAIPLRRTNRRSFLPRPVASAITDVMIAAATAEGATMVRLSPDEKHLISHLVHEADRAQFGNPAFRAELTGWLNPIGSRRKDGIPFVEKEYGSNLPFTVARTIRSPSLGNDFGKLEEDHIDQSPVVFVIGTPTDDRVDWIACGQALEAVLLHATSLGLSASFLNQVLEVPGSRAQIGEMIPGIGFPQMVLRIGIPEDPVHHPAPRRDVADVLEMI
ncbi:MAG: nitroreductase family protein [Proteobacteria bacterium]|nr:nitroreductase family protein [Pseudomonadota bacterium]